MATGNAKLFPGLLFEYRVGGVLRGVCTGVERDGGLYLQHVMLWPGAPRGTLLRMLSTAETHAWARGPAWIILDVENRHPQAEKLYALAERCGFRPFNHDDQTRWFIKHRSE